jgi:hypothetical protein
VYQGTALNADERDWLTDARRGRQEAPGEKRSFGLALLASTLAKNREAGELESRRAGSEPWGTVQEGASRTIPARWL